LTADLKSVLYSPIFAPLQYDLSLDMQSNLGSGDIYLTVKYQTDLERTHSSSRFLICCVCVES